MKRRRLGVPSSLYLLAALIFLAAYIAIVIVIKNLTSPLDRSDTGLKPFEIEKGESVKSVANRLSEAGLVRSPLGFRVSVKRKDLDDKIQAGVYQLSPSMTAEEVAQALTRGMKDIRVTIPEGYRLEQIAETFASTLGLSADEVVLAGKGKEGYLFPDTYFFASGTGAERVIDKLSTTFDSKTADLAPTKEDIVLASLVERETKGDAEKPVVAGILKKRLSAGWPLQLDATIQYIAGDEKEWWPNTTLLDRKRPSLYNTYLHQGLPPAPICNPGLKSIEAVLNPVESNYWYYLHAPDGSIHYAETSAEHEENIDTYIR